MRNVSSAIAHRKAPVSMETGKTSCNSYCGREEASVGWHGRKCWKGSHEQMYYVIMHVSCMDITPLLDSRLSLCMCVCVPVHVYVPLSQVEQSDLEKHKQRCPLWHRRRPHNSEENIKNFRWRLICGQACLNLSSSLRNDNMKQALDQHLRGENVAQSKQASAFIHSSCKSHVWSFSPGSFLFNNLSPIHMLTDASIMGNVVLLVSDIQHSPSCSVCTISLSAIL